MLRVLTLAIAMATVSELVHVSIDHGSLSDTVYENRLDDVSNHSTDHSPAEKHPAADSHQTPSVVTRFTTAGGPSTAAISNAENVRDDAISRWIEDRCLYRMPLRWSRSYLETCSLRI